MHAYITVGVSGSGKTTFANSLKGYEIISRDDIRAKLVLEKTGVPMTSWKQWNFKNEGEVTEIQTQMISDAAAAGKNIVIADTNLNMERAEILQKKLEGLGYSVEYRFFHGVFAYQDISLDECLKRDAARPMSVGFHVIHKQWRQMIDSWGDFIVEQYIQDESLPKAILVDIDGTIAEMHDRGAFEWHKVGNDKPRKHVVELILGYSHVYDDVDIIVLSGRDSVCREETVEWLLANEIPFDRLFMRKEGDMRKDSIVKLELFEEHIRHKYNVQMVFDDRKQVVQLWHDLGLNVINVGHINEYF